MLNTWDWSITVSPALIKFSAASKVGYSPVEPIVMTEALQKVDWRKKNSEMNKNGFIEDRNNSDKISKQVEDLQ